jgi:hypothetical protein
MGFVFVYFLLLSGLVVRSRKRRRRRRRRRRRSRMLERYEIAIGQ